MIATRNDPRLRDQIAGQCAATVERLGAPAKVLAFRTGAHERSARRWARDGKGNPLYSASVLTHEASQIGSACAFEIVAHFTAVADRGLLTGMRDDALVTRFWTLQDSEGEAEGAANRLQNTFAQSGDLEGLEVAARSHAARLLELAAVCAELRHRGLDPRR